jgi:hypothetical protein
VARPHKFQFCHSPEERQGKDVNDLYAICNLIRWHMSPAAENLLTPEAGMAN